MLQKGLLLAMVLTWVSGACSPYACLGVGEVAQNCHACNALNGFYPNGSGGCNTANIAGCVYYNSEGGCAICDEGWVKKGCGCRRDLYPNDKCEVYARLSDACIECAPEFYPNSDGVCTAVSDEVSNCSLYSDDGVCSSCASGYFLFSGICLQHVENCMAPTGPRCARCNNGYQRSVYTPALYDGFHDHLLNYILTDTYDIGSFDCKLVVTNCKKFSDITSCLICNEGYYVMASGNCGRVTAPVANCALHNGATTCAYCNPNFYLNNNVCQSITTGVANCLYYDTLSTCSRCVSGYFVSGGNCAAVTTAVANCAVHSANGVCQFCNTEMYLASGVCTSLLSPIANCARQSGSSCLMCADGFYLTGNACTAITTAVANCIRYSNATTCMFCKDHFKLIGNECKAIQDIANCAIYSAANVCQFCKTGFYLNSNACLSITSAVTNCKFYATATTCLQCLENFAVNAAGNACVVAPVTNCDVYTSVTQCQYCISGFYYSAGVNNCVSVTTIQNCARYSAANTCVFCSNGFYLSDNACIAIASADNVNNCITYTRSGSISICSRCATNFYPINGPAGKILCAPLNTGAAGAITQNCRIYGSTSTANKGVCTECSSNYYLTGANVCQPSALAVFKCDNYSASFACLRCADTHYLTSGNCVQATTTVNNCFQFASATACLYCKEGFYINSATNTCNAIVTGKVDNCAFYSATSCVVCANGFYLNGSVCVAITTPVTGCAYYSSATQCLECTAGRILNGNTCWVPYNGANCKYLANDSNCAICNTGYQFVSGACTSYSPNTNCVESNNSNGCRSCSTLNYLANATTCTLRTAGIANCRVYTSATVCSLCNSGYHIASNVCVNASPVITGCQYYSTAGVCIQCSTGALNANGSKCIANCEIAGAACNLCNAGYFIQAGECVKATTIVDGCEIYKADGVCDYCAPGYVWIDNKTCRALRGLGNCRWAFYNICAICEPGYYEAPFGKCQEVPEVIDNCLIYDPKEGTSCEVCKLTHYQKWYRGTCEELPAARDCYCYWGQTFNFDWTH